jgi:hypothetical protein
MVVRRAGSAHAARPATRPLGGGAGGTADLRSWDPMSASPDDGAAKRWRLVRDASRS